MTHSNVLPAETQKVLDLDLEGLSAAPICSGETFPI